MSESVYQKTCVSEFIRSYHCGCHALRGGGDFMSLRNAVLWGELYELEECSSVEKERKG
jgi:hypothetical protein